MAASVELYMSPGKVGKASSHRPHHSPTQPTVLKRVVSFSPCYPPTVPSLVLAAGDQGWELAPDHKTPCWESKQTHSFSASQEACSSVPVLSKGLCILSAFLLCFCGCSWSKSSRCESSYTALPIWVGAKSQSCLLFIILIQKWWILSIISG